MNFRQAPILLSRRTLTRLFAILSIAALGGALSATTLTFDADPGTPGIQTGSANWHDAGVWWDGSANVSWSDGSDAVIYSGSTVTINQTTNCGAMTLGGVVILRNYRWTITGATSGTGQVRMDLPKNPPSTGLYFETGSAVTFAWTLRANSAYNKSIQVVVKGAGTAVTYNGFFEHTGGGNKAYVSAIQDASFTFGPSATVNNQLPDWNARVFTLSTDGTGLFIFDPGFDVDMGGTQANPVGGLSVYQLDNATMVSQTSQNLPQIWKGAAGSIKHHGGLKLRGDTPSTVIIDNEPHFFDGGVAWKVDWTLETREDLTHTPEGRFESNLDDGFGPDWGVTENSTMTKTGTAKFIMLGDHAYPPGSRYLIQEGVIEMHTDPNYIGDHPNPSPNFGPYLQAEISGSAMLHLLPGETETYTMESVSLADTARFRVDGGKAALTGGLSAGSGSDLILKTSPTVLGSGPVVSAAGAVSLDGMIVLEEEAGTPLEAGTYPLVGYGTLSSLTATVDASALAVSSAPGFSATLLDNPAEQRVDLVLAAAEPVGAKNVILIIGDGAGYEIHQIARYFRHGADNTEHIDSSAWTKLGMSTYGNDNPVYNPAIAWLNYDFLSSYATGSAQAGTTLATGVKTGRENINLGPGWTDLSGQTLTAIADAGGRATGVVADLYFSHATPAVFAMASNVHRNNYTAIAHDILQNSILDVVLSAGHPYYDENGDPVTLNQKMYERGGENMYLDVLNGVNTLGWTVVDTTPGLEALKTGTHPGRILGIAPVGESLHYRRDGAAKWNSNALEPYEIPLNAGVPELKDLAEASLNLLSQDSDGFFVMIEAGTVDWAGHDNDKARLVETSVGMMETIDVVTDWVENHSSWKETLVVVLADHDCGLVFGPQSNQAGFEFQPVVNIEVGIRPGFRFNSGAHTNALIPLFARGPNQDGFNDFATGTDTVRGAYLDIDDVYPVISEALTAPASVAPITYKSWLEGQGLTLDTPNAKMREDYLGSGDLNISRYFFAMPFASTDTGHLPKAVRDGDSLRMVYTYRPGTGIHQTYEGSDDLLTWSPMEEGIDYTIISDTVNPDGTHTCTIEMIGTQPMQFVRIALN